MADAGKSGLQVTLKDVHRIFPPAVVAVDGVSLSIASGDFVAFLGPSGCGKSTLLRIIAGLDQPDQGQAIIGPDHFCPAFGCDTPLDVAYVFQDPCLLPWRTVLDNAALPLELHNHPKSVRRQQAAAVLEQLGLADALERYPNQLSGGMRMRVSLARALITNPKLLLLDEPFAALDAITRQKLDEMLRHLWLTRNMTILFVTHSISEATFLAQRAIVFSRRPARVVLDHAIDLPQERTVQLRADPTFARHMASLQQALTLEEVEQ
ncbi:MAG: ABC transporter ATP-binding protein [Phycisphaerales bacterium]|nr:ABC transporter ATP-binding protein [Phycisphaerales bacterium]